MHTTSSLPASILNLTRPSATLSCAETAKLVRKALKEAFPEIKFAVRSSVYSGGASIRIGWFMGQLVGQVEAVVGRLAGSRFDGMTDTSHVKTHAVDGQPTHFGANYVFCEREVNQAKLSALAEVLAGSGQDKWLTIAAHFGLGREACRWLDYNMDAREFACAMLRSLPQPAFDGRSSATADAVTCLSGE